MKHTRSAPTTAYAAVPVYVTKDGSLIRELMHPGVHDNRNQSLAEAVVAPGARTLLHRHCSAEELYHVTQGQGQMTLGDERFAIAAGDTVSIAPGTPHCVENTGTLELRILCCCAPPYSHADTDLLEGPADSPTVPRGAARRG